MPLSSRLRGEPIVIGGPSDVHWSARITEWLGARAHLTLGACASWQGRDAPGVRAAWARCGEQVVGVSVVTARGTWFVEASSDAAAELLAAEVLHDAPPRIATSGEGKALFRAILQREVGVVREHDQWVMMATPGGDVPGGEREGRWASTSDIPALDRYQEQYNAERAVADCPDWDALVAARRVAVVERDGEIVSVLQRGIRFERFVSIGGTYTFPRWRRQGLARRLTRFVVANLAREGDVAHLVVDADNAPAIALYESVGLRKMGAAYVAYLARNQGGVR